MPKVSAIVIVSERFDPVEPLFRKYRQVLVSSGETFELVYVLDGKFPEVKERLLRLREGGESVEVIELGKSYGESTALNAALDIVRGNVILTLPAYSQVDETHLHEVAKAVLDKSADVAIAVRHPRRDSLWNRLQAGSFRNLANWISGTSFRDLGCGVRAYDRRVFDDIRVYGDLHRFVPLLAARAGFTVLEVEIPQSKADLGRRMYRPGVYTRRFLDILTVFFLVKFTKKPLRFFGLLGIASASVGGFVLLWLTVERLFFAVPLGDRPALLLSTLLFAIGIQLISVGLIGELIIFTHASDIKEYAVDKIAHSGSDNESDDQSDLDQSADKSVGGFGTVASGSVESELM